MRHSILIAMWTFSIAVIDIRIAVAQEPVFTTVCSIRKEPAAFAGKIVKLRATVRTGMETSAIVEPDGACEGGMWFESAQSKEEHTNDLDDRDVQLQRQTPVYLQKDDDLKKFEDALQAHLYARLENSGCIGCSLYTVTATMVGRVDYAGEEGLGFGHLNMARLRFVMESVSDVATVERKFDENEWSATPIRFPHGTVSGKVTDASGKGVHFAEVEAVPVEGEIPINTPKVMTEDDGTYKFDLRPGTYLLVVNRDSPATTSVPMDTTYYPSAEQRKNAQIISIVDRQTLEGIDIKPIRGLRARYLRVRVIWPNGHAVEEANVNVAEASDPYAIAGDDDGGVKHTDKDGWATLLAYEGKSYRLYADIYKKPGYVPYCENSFLLPDDFRDGMAVQMVLRRQDDGCRGQWDEAAKPLPVSAVLP